MHVKEEHAWRLETRCAKELTPYEADALFFPPAGGKPHKAKVFCDGCPFKSRCLVDAIEKKLVGYFAGTTDDERRQMVFVHNMKPKVTGLDMPPEPDRNKRTIYRKVFTAPDPREWLDNLELEPAVQELEDSDPVILILV